MATFYIDPDNGSDANAGTSFAAAWKTITLGATAARLTAGDTVRIKASPTPTLVGTASFTNSSDTITLSSAVTQDVDDCESVWTVAAAQGANVTCATTTTRKSGTNAITLTCGSSSTTGLLAYKALSALDLSSYQQLNFWLTSNAGAIASGALQMKLCSDSAGATAVATINVPATGVAGNWHAMVIDTAGALPSGINSIALYAVSKPAASYTVTLDNIFASKASGSADSLTLRSLVSKNSGSQGGYAAGEAWWAIRSISGTTVKLDCANGPTSVTMRGYVGTTESVSLYKRECFQFPNLATTNTLLQAFNKNGTQTTAPITYTGGWNRTDMSTQTGDSYFDSYGSGGFGSGPVNGSTGITAINLDRLHWVRYLVGCNGQTLAYYGTLSNCSVINCSSIGHQPGQGNANVYTSFFAVACVSGFALNVQANLLMTSCYAYSNSQVGIQISTGNYRITKCGMRNNGTYGFYPSRAAGNLVSCTFDSNPQSINLSDGFNVFASDTVFNDAVEIVTAPTAGANNYVSDFTLYSQNHGGVVGAQKTQSDGYVIQSTVSNRRTASGVAWQVSPLATTRSASYPINLSLARIYCSAGQTITVSVWVRRDNVGLTCQLLCRGGQIAGVANDVVSSAASGAVGGYNDQLSVTITPTSDGVVEFLAQTWGGATFNAYYDDLSIS